MGDLVASLSRGRIRESEGAHLDPDLSARVCPRPEGFRGAFGQCGAAARHLEREGVGRGDLFLFFGWFREVERTAKGFAFRRGAPDLHLLFGWLQVASVQPVEDVEDRRCARHPHHFGRRPEPNHLYLAARKLDVLGPGLGKGGAGLFARLAPARVLTAADSKRSEWELPSWFKPRRGRFPLTYHGDAARYRVRNGGVRLQSVARGQEFVLDTTHYPEAIAWARSMFMP